ncbi:MAG: hypothetical protein ACRDVZ_02435 [Jiangellaceae bacterium]
MATTTIDRKPLYAVAGAADAAVETLRELPGRIADAMSDDKLRTELRTRFNDLPADAKALRTEFPELVKDAPAKAAEIPARMREFASHASHEAAKTYAELATRGEAVVARFRNDHGDTVDDTVASIRGRVAAAAEDVADAADKVADDLGAAAKKAAPATKAAPVKTTVKPRPAKA